MSFSFFDLYFGVWGALMWPATLVIIAVLVLGFYQPSLDSIKSKVSGNGQYGKSRFATVAEKHRINKRVLFDPESWRKGINLPETQGVIVDSEKVGRRVYALVDTNKAHFSLTGQSDYGKTSSFFYPNIEYSLATKTSFFSTDTKGSLGASWYYIAKECYGFNVINFDFRSPLQSAHYNFLHPINKYMDQYLACEDKMSPEAIIAIAKAEKHAKIAAKSIIYSGETKSFGQNQYFYDGAEALIGSVFLMISEFGKQGERHVLSAYKLVQDFMVADGEDVDMKKVQKSQFRKLLDMLPSDHPCRLLAGTSLAAPNQVMMNIVSTAMSKLISFIDSELEQVLCFDSDFDIEDFANNPTAVFLNLPEEDPTKWFLISMIMKQTWNELIAYADEFPEKKLPRLVRYWMDEFGTYPAIDGAAEAFSAIRSRLVSLVVSTQTLSQFEEKYGKEGAEVIRGNCSTSIIMAPSPTSQDAKTYSDLLGNMTVSSGSISDSTRSGSGRSKTVQLIAQPLMFPQDLARMKKGDVIVMKAGEYPQNNHLLWYPHWGITIPKIYTPPINKPADVKYCTFDYLKEAIGKYRVGYNRAIAEQNNADALATKLSEWNAIIDKAENTTYVAWDEILEEALKGNEEMGKMMQKAKRKQPSGGGSNRSPIKQQDKQMADNLDSDISATVRWI